MAALRIRSLGVRSLIPIVALLSALAAGCARTGYLADADSRFDDTWVVTSITADGAPIDLGSSNILVDIDTQVAAVTAETGCRGLLGSFTLADDGRAGFTLPGSTRDCDGVEPWLADLDAVFLATISGVESWTLDGGQLELAGPVGSLTLEPAG